MSSEAPRVPPESSEPYDLPSASAEVVESTELAIDARGLSKVYHVYSRPQDRLWQMLWPGRRRFYRPFTAVEGVDLQVRHGETVGIVGRNGSGKSTLLRMICGTLEPSGGELRVAGTVAPLLTIGAGFNRDFSGRENVFLNAAILGMSGAEIAQRLDSIIEFADIGDFFDQPVKSYSAGMYSRLAFAVAVSSDPDILVIDEVLAVGDEAFNRKCFARIEELKSRGSTILFVSHASDRVIELCDWAILMEGGERLLSGEPKAVVSRYKRLVHAPPARVAAIRREIRELAGARPATPPLREAAPEEPELAGVGAKAVRASRLEAAHFDPNLKPKSTVEFSDRGARIEDPHVVDDESRRVNLLLPGQVYTYTYQVRFLEPSRAVRFGMMLKSMVGFEIGGQVSHPDGDGIERVEAGTIARVRFRFRSALAPGAYFLNAGVLGEFEGAECYLHRVLDATMLRVLPGERGRVTGKVDLSPPDCAGAEIELE
jgi:lipopolysaccharide transport system ATP-binding protein